MHDESKVSKQVIIIPNETFQDRHYARSAEEIATVLGLGEQWAGGIKWAVAPVCGITGDGLYTAMSSLRNIIDKTRQETRRKSKSNATVR